MIRIVKERQLESIYGVLLKSNVKGVRFMKKMGFAVQQLDEETVKAILSFMKEERK